MWQVFLTIRTEKFKKNIYCVGTTFIASGTTNVSETDSKHWVWCSVVCLSTHTHSASLACLPLDQHINTIKQCHHYNTWVCLSINFSPSLSHVSTNLKQNFGKELFNENSHQSVKKIFNDSTPHADFISPKTVNETDTMYFIPPILQKDLEIQTSLNASWILLGFVSKTSLVPVLWWTATIIMLLHSRCPSVISLFLHQKKC